MILIFIHCLVFFSCITLFVAIAELLGMDNHIRGKHTITRQVVVNFMMVHHQSLLVDGRVAVVVVVVGQRRDHQHLSQHMVEDMRFFIHPPALA